MKVLSRNRYFVCYLRHGKPCIDSEHSSQEEASKRGDKMVMEMEHDPFYVWITKLEEYPADSCFDEDVE